jgi:protein-S-isoprenylcysteine O-methyltransferase Ste14
MDNNLIFRLILGLLFVLVIGTRRYFETKTAKIANEGLIQDKDSRTQIFLQSLLLTISNLAMIVFLINPNWMAWSSITLPAWVRWVGAILGIAGCAVLIWTHRILGENFFGGMKLRKDHQLIKKGPYRWVRHPMYTAFILIGLAWFFLSENWFIAGFWLAATVLVIVTRLQEEERMMLRHFGESYQIYAQQTGRFLPRFWPKANKPDAND